MFGLFYMEQSQNLHPVNSEVIVYVFQNSGVISTFHIEFK